MVQQAGAVEREQSTYKGDTADDAHRRGEVKLRAAEVAQRHAGAHGQRIDAGGNTHQNEPPESQGGGGYFLLLFLTLPGFVNDAAAQRAEYQQHNPGCPGAYHRAERFAAHVPQQRHSGLEGTHRQRQPQSGATAPLAQHHAVGKGVNRCVYGKSQGNEGDFQVIHKRGAHHTKEHRPSQGNVNAKGRIKD